MEKRTAAVILAGGRGTRMGGETPKQFMKLGSYPLIYYSLKTFCDSFIDEIALVCPKGEEEYCSEEIVEKYGFSKVKNIVTGGQERYHSVYNALKTLRCTAEGDNREPCDIVFIHDGARPLVTYDILARAYQTARTDRAAVVAVPAKDTIKISDTAGFGVETIRRDLAWQMQTPQVFDFYEIYDAYSKLMESEESVVKSGTVITDDAMVLEMFADRRVRFVMGDYSNIKITTPEDMVVADALMRNMRKEDRS